MSNNWAPNPPPEFTPDENPKTVGKRWEDWCLRFGLYWEACGVTEARKKAFFLSTAGLKVIKLYYTLEPDDNIRKNHTFKDCLKIITDYFGPKYNVYYERYSLRKENPLPGEGIQDFVNRLREKGAHCSFDNYSLDAEIMQIVLEKTKLPELRRKVFMDNSYTLEKVIDLGRDMQNALEQCKEVIDAMPSEIKQVNQPSNNKQHWKKSETNGNKQRQSNQYQNKSGENQGVKNNMQCYRCGRLGHNGTVERDKCPATNTQCHQCGGKGHFKQMCMSSPGQPSQPKQHNNYPTHKQQSNHTTHRPQGFKQQSFKQQGFRQGGKQVRQTTQEEGSDSDSDFALQVRKENHKQDRYILKVQINGIPVGMQLDTGADITIISEHVANQLKHLNIVKTHRTIRDYGNKIIPVVGKAFVDVKFNHKMFKNLPVIITAGKRQSLLGIDWEKHFGLVDKSLITQNKVSDECIQKVTQAQVRPISEICGEYKMIFGPDLGTVKNASASLVLKPDANPIFRAPRQIPYALKQKVEQEILRNEAEGKWKRVTYSQWATPLVPVAKSDGSVRICGDFKVTVNSQLQVAQHPLPNIHDMLAALGNSTVFSKIDLRTAFQQLEMDEKSQEICTFSTHLGLFRPSRLPYGVASSPALWQQQMDKIFTGLPGVCVFVDDILIAAKDDIQHQERLAAVFDRIKENGLRIRKDKCQFKVKAVEYLGFYIDEKGIHKTKDKVSAIRQAKIPENVKELQSFLGLVNFYHKFVKDLATIAEPLYQLLSKGTQWNWTQKCQQAYDSVKAELTSKQFLTHHISDLPIKLVCDASRIGIGAVLAHVMPDGSEKPIAFASRLLNKAEQNYSQIDKEALSLIYGVKKYHMYLYGRKKFTLVTDHKPLLKIFGPKSGLPTIVAARLQRWAVTLAAYNYDIEYRSTNNMGNADALSRLPVDEAPTTYSHNILFIDQIDSDTFPITSKHIAQATKQDPSVS